MNDGGDCRTVLATPGLLNIMKFEINMLQEWNIIS